MNKIYAVLLLVVLPKVIFAQDVKNTSYITSTGEKVLRFECIIPIDKEKAWKLFSTSEGWTKWAAPVVSVDLKVGGLILTNYDATKTVDDSSSIRLPIINYIEGEMITLKVILNNAFSERARKEDKNLQEIIQISDLGDGKTKITSSMIGWGSGEEWNKTYNFFDKGNEWTYMQLVKLFQK